MIFTLKMSSHNVFFVILFMAVVKYEKPDLQVEWWSIRNGNRIVIFRFLSIDCTKSDSLSMQGTI